MARSANASRPSRALFTLVALIAVLFGSIALSPPAGTAWSFRGPLRWLGAAGRLPVSGAQRRAYAFWEIAARAGVPTVAVNWWASESVPGHA